MKLEQAQFILHKEGLDNFSFRELMDMLNDKYARLPGDVREAIINVKMSAEAYAAGRGRKHASIR